MFLAFDLVDKLKFQNPTSFLEKGRALKASSTRQVKAKLETFLNPNGSLDGSAMQVDWFPLITSDVFISHSHRDEERALMLAGWLSINFDLRPFIDSCVWGNSNDLLRMIDDEYCWNQNTETFSYEKRNGSTSHVHMMLATALAKMIDKTECAMILRTSNSITSEEATEKTASPWLFWEIATMSVIRRRSPSRGLVKKAQEILGETRKDLKIEYLLDLMSMNQIDNDILNKWIRACDADSLRGSKTLDVLYALVAK